MCDADERAEAQCSDDATLDVVFIDFDTDPEKAVRMLREAFEPTE